MRGTFPSQPNFLGPRGRPARWLSRTHEIIHSRPAAQVPLIQRTPGMLIGLAILFALLAILCGYVVFKIPGQQTPYIWDSAFLFFCIAFLVVLVTLIWRRASKEIRENSNLDDTSEGR